MVLSHNNLTFSPPIKKRIV